MASLNRRIVNRGHDVNGEIAPRLATDVVPACHIHQTRPKRLSDSDEAK